MEYIHTIIVYREASLVNQTHPLIEAGSVWLTRLREAGFSNITHFFLNLSPIFISPLFLFVNIVFYCHMNMHRSGTKKI